MKTEAVLNICKYKDKLEDQKSVLKFEESTKQNQLQNIILRRKDESSNLVYRNFMPVTSYNRHNSNQYLKQTNESERQFDILIGEYNKTSLF